MISLIWKTATFWWFSSWRIHHWLRTASCHHFSHHFEIPLVCQIYGKNTPFGWNWLKIFLSLAQTRSVCRLTASSSIAWLSEFLNEKGTFNFFWPNCHTEDEPNGQIPQKGTQPIPSNALANRTFFAPSPPASNRLTQNRLNKKNRKMIKLTITVITSNILNISIHTFQFIYESTHGITIYYYLIFSVSPFDKTSRLECLKLPDPGHAPPHQAFQLLIGQFMTWRKTNRHKKIGSANWLWAAGLNWKLLDFTKCLRIWALRRFGSKTSSFFNHNYPPRSHFSSCEILKKLKPPTSSPPNFFGRLPSGWKLQSCEDAAADPWCLLVNGHWIEIFLSIGEWGKIAGNKNLEHH